MSTTNTVPIAAAPPPEATISDTVWPILARGAAVEVRLEIDAKIPDGASDEIVRTVTENARTLA